MTMVRKKLIEVALPLKAINEASAREKSIRHGHPSTLHLWWARRPLAAARAVIFAQMVDDPSSWPDLFPTVKKQERERQRLFKIIEELVKWENTTNEDVLQKAREEIWASWRRACAENADHPRAKELFDRHRLPAFHDPFAGGGSLPLEAQRLGLEAYASDLNPVAVLICKAMIEIPPKFAGKPPVNLESRKDKDLFKREWHGALGLAEDVRYYGKWMRDEAEKRIGHLYPKIEVTAEMAKGRPDLKPYVGKSLTVIAWLWSRTVKSPNPAFANVDVPLVSNFMLSSKAGQEAYVQPVIENGSYHFTVKMGMPKHPEEVSNGTKLSRGSFRCLMSEVPIRYEYIDAEANAGRMSERLMAIVAEGTRVRVFLPPNVAMEAIARSAKPEWKPDAPSRGTWASNAQGRRYGFQTFGDYFTPRQLVALTTYSDLVKEARERVKNDAQSAGLGDDGDSIEAGGNGAQAYADAVGLYLGMGVSRLADICNALCSWETSKTQVRHLFTKQAIPMLWDYGENNLFAEAAGDYKISLSNLLRVLERMPATVRGKVFQQDAQSQLISNDKVISTDPPYYDNVCYADLSDFFYVWLRHTLKPVLTNLFATVESPKAEELVATPYRHGTKEEAEKFFLDGMTEAMRRIAKQSHPAFPITIYYAFKQTETDASDGTASTGWDTFLEAVIRAGFNVSGTWPMRTELSNRMISTGTNALASSIILVCRSRSSNAPTATRREFVTALKAELPMALIHLQHGNIAPVDLAQAAIGPGMAVYTRFEKVLNADGSTLSVREALTLINQTLDEGLAEQEGDFDADSRWALIWFEQSGFGEGEYGMAEQLSKSKNTSVSGMVESGIVASRAGKVRLLRPNELAKDWDPAHDKRVNAWEMVHQLIRALEMGEADAAALAAKLGVKAEIARELAYRLYVICERKKRAQEALSYNSLVQSWPEIMKLSREPHVDVVEQADLVLPE